MTLNYSEKIQAFQSFLNIEPLLYIEINGRLFYLQDGNLYEYGSQHSPSYGSITFIFSVNSDLIQTKVFDNVEFYSNHSDVSIEFAKFYTDSQVSEQLSLYDNREKTYKFSIPRSISNYERIRDKVLLCEYKLTTEDSSRVFSIPYIKTKYRYSFI